MSIAGWRKRAAESLERAAFSAPKPPSWQAARLLALDRDGREEWQQKIAAMDARARPAAAGLSAGQLLLLACGFDIPPADLLGGP
jgi:hypothetical protein